MSIRILIITACMLFTPIAFLPSTGHAQQDAQKRFSKSIQIPKNLKNKNFANNEDSPLITNRGKNRHERMRGRQNRRDAMSRTTNADDRTAGQNINANRNQQGRRNQVKQRDIRKNRITSEKINTAVRDLIND